jgi:hypothetical protein
MNVRPVALLAAGVALAGCGGTTTSSATSPAPHLATCGTVPVSDGPSRAEVDATAVGPTSAKAATSLHLAVRLRSLDGKSHVFDTGVAAVLLLRDGKVVGQYEGAVAAVGIETTVPATGQAASELAAEVQLSGCPTRPVDLASPDVTRKPLPAGEYEVVVVLPDVRAGGPFGNLVTAPIPLRVTAASEPLPTCGDVPVSDGPSRNRVGATLEVPTTARSGSTVPVQVQLRSTTGKAEPFDTGLPIDVLVVRDGSVVGRSDGPIAGVGLQLNVPAQGSLPMIDQKNRLPAYFGQVSLSGCPAGPDGASPSPRVPLPPGSYQLVADVEDNGDFHNDNPGPHGRLVTQAVPIQVT